MKQRIFAIAIVSSILCSCDPNPVQVPPAGEPSPSDPADASDANDSDASDANDSNGGQGGIEPPEAGRHECNGTVCGRSDDCCTGSSVCGRDVPADIFVEECVGSASRGGELSDSCSPSPDFCQPSGFCQSFAGCTQPEGDCGYWVEVVKIVGGVEAIFHYLNLGCVDPSEFQTGG